MANLTEDFWKENLSHVMTGESDFMVDNPAIEFTKKAKAGCYDKISDEEYNDLLKECEAVSTLWQKLPRKASGDLLLEALKSINLSVSDFAAAVSMLSGYQFPDKTDKDPAAAIATLDALHAAHENRIRASREKFIGLDSLNTYDWSPKGIYRFLSERVLGQDEAKKAASLVFYNHVEGRRSNTIFCGPK